MLLPLFLLLTSISFLLLILSFHSKFQGLPASLFSIFAGILFLYLMYEAFNLQIASIKMQHDTIYYYYANVTAIFHDPTPPTFSEHIIWEWQLANETSHYDYGLEYGTYTGDYNLSLYLFVLGIFSIIKGLLYDIMIRFFKGRD